MIEIKALENTDSFDDLISLSKNFFEDYQSHDGELFDIDNLQDEHILTYFQKTLDNESAITYLALEETNIIGYVTLFIQNQADFYKIKKIGSISGFMVSPSFRNKGIGKQLFDKALEYFRSKNIKYYKLFTSVNNTNAIDFYLENGMTPFQTIMLGKTSEN